VKAVVAASAGGPEVLEERDLPEPSPGHGEVAIEVAYAGINFADVQRRRRGPDEHTGELVVPGLEVSGRVSALGAGVESLNVGQEVCAFTGIGGYAEVAVAPATLTIPLDQIGGLDLLTAACAPTVATTSWSLIHKAARLERGESVLIHAAAGGIGTVAGQLARDHGASPVLGTVGRPEKADYAAGFGYDAVIARDGFADAVRELTDGGGVDAVLDSIGGAVSEQSLEVLAPYGRLVTFGNASGGEFRAVPGELMKRSVGVIGYSIGWLAETAPELVREVALSALGAIASGAAQIDVTEVVGPDDVADVHRRLESGETRGKLAIRLGAAA
jgi:NADPH2:quinone reductase